MINLKIEDILGISNARLITGDPKDVLEYFSKDTRTIKEGDTYLAFVGDNFDGNMFFQDAFLKGAKTCILSKFDMKDKDQYSDKNIILVDDTLEFITLAATKKRESISVPVIAVTGSVGKTSTKNLIADVLSKKYHVLKTSGNLNTKIGLSLTLLNYRDEECIVLEMGMNRFGEISTLTNIAKPTMAVITNIGTSHIGNLGSRENILKAKLEILEGLSGPILVNYDNDLLHEWANGEKNREVITFGIDFPALYQATNLKYSKKGSSFVLDDQKFQIPVIGKAFVYNALASYIIGKLLNVEDEDIACAFKELKSEKHRMEIKNYGEVTVIDDTYNASYDSVSLALEVLSKFEGRKIAVLGDIFELGDYSVEIHRNIGHLIKKNSIDLLVTVGEMAKYINEEAIYDGLPEAMSFHFESNEEAVRFLNDNIQDGDVLLVKASHGMNFAWIVEKLDEKRN